VADPVALEREERGIARSGDNARVLVVDDDPGVCRLLSRILVDAGYLVHVAVDAETALAGVAAHHPDVILLDVVFPGADGFTLCRQLKRDSATRLTPIILVTGLTDRESRIKGHQAGADDFLTKPIDSPELLARVASLVRLKRYTDDLDSAAAIISTLAVMIETRDGYSEGHCHRVANHAVAIGRTLGLGAADLQVLHRGGFLHDIGMLAIAPALVLRPGRLEPDEFNLVKTHTVVGDDLCRNLRALQAARPIVRHHHERLDGSGYPDGLAGDAVPLLAQIVSVVDAHDALTSSRPYQPQLSSPEALALLRKEVDRGWRQGTLVDALTEVITSRPQYPPVGDRPAPGLSGETSWVKIDLC
jgi:putative two-component system response regulator